MLDIVIIGAGGLAREVAFLIESINRIDGPTWNLLGFVEADGQPVGHQVGDYSVICNESELTGMETAAAIAIGNVEIAQKIAERFEKYAKIIFPNLVHPNVVWDQRRVTLGKGNIICPGTVFSTDIKVGSHNFFNMMCNITHDDEIGDYCNFSPGTLIMGGVKVGDGCSFGAGAIVIPYKSIGEHVIVGAGSVVINDVQPNKTVVGVPAREMTPKSS
jgi:sugar O-acyltransferase (sialic acid O-acetyltransferase NeuD family)